MFVTKESFRRKLALCLLFLLIFQNPSFNLQLPQQYLVWQKRPTNLELSDTRKPSVIYINSQMLLKKVRQISNKEQKLRGHFFFFLGYRNFILSFRTSERIVWWFTEDTILKGLYSVCVWERESNCSHRVLWTCSLGKWKWVFQPKWVWKATTFVNGGWLFLSTKTLL